MNMDLEGQGQAGTDFLYGALPCQGDLGRQIGTVTGVQTVQPKSGQVVGCGVQPLGLGILQVKTADHGVHVLHTGHATRLFDDIADAGMGTPRNDHKTIITHIRQSRVIKQDVVHRAVIIQTFTQRRAHLEVVNALNLAKGNKPGRQPDRLRGRGHIELPGQPVPGQKHADLRLVIHPFRSESEGVGQQPWPLERSFLGRYLEIMLDECIQSPGVVIVAVGQDHPVQVQQADPHAPGIDEKGVGIPGIKEDPCLLFHNVHGEPRFSQEMAAHERVVVDQKCYVHENTSLYLKLEVGIKNLYDNAMRNHNLLLPYAFLILLFALPTHAQAMEPARFLALIDGDSMLVEYRGRSQEVRLIGIDAPEWQQDYGTKAKSYALSFCYGKTLNLEFDTQRKDRYGRLLAYAYCGAQMLNEEIVRAGYAIVGEYKPNTKYHDRLLRAQKEAKTKRHGFWLRGGLKQTPAQWRRTHQK